MKEKWNFHRNENMIDDEGVIRPILHDRYAKDVYIKNDRLIFEFPDGFGILPQDETNPFDDVKLTTASRMSVRMISADTEDCVMLTLFKRHRFFRGCGFTTVSNPSIEKLAEKIHSGVWKLEFLYRYTKPLSVLFMCAIHGEGKYYDLQMQIDCKEIDYYWNEIIEDSEW